MEIDEFIKEVKKLLELSQPAPAYLSSVHYILQKSKLVGFFHSRVKTNEAVKSKQILATIRVAGRENEIEAEITGIVRKIFTNDDQPIEYNQPLFLIQPPS